jgi:hypothetical protein
MSLFHTFQNNIQGLVQIMDEIATTFNANGETNQSVVYTKENSLFWWDTCMGHERGRLS